MLTLLALFSVLVGSGGFVGAHFQIFSPFFGAMVTAGALCFLGLLFFMSLAALFRSGKTSWLAIFLGLLFFAAAGGGGYFFFLNPINDLTTDVRSPPKFLHPIYPFRVEAGGEYLDKSLQLNREYDPALAAVQLIHYPGFEGMAVKAAAKDVYAEALRQIDVQLPNWKKLLDDPKLTHAEYEVAWGPYKFVDDLVIEVRPVTGHDFDSRIELRSRSRWPLKTDFGMNMLRLRELKVRFELVMKPLEDRMASERAAWEKENAEENAPRPEAKGDAKAESKGEISADTKADTKAQGELPKGSPPPKAPPEKAAESGKAPAAPPADAGAIKK